MANRLIDSYIGENFSGGLDAVYSGHSQSFEVPAGKGGDLSLAVFKMFKSGSPTGNAYAKLYSHSGTFGTSSEPDTLLATSDALDVSTLTGTATLINSIFSGVEQYTLVAETYYCITIEYTNGDADNKVMIRMHISSTTHPGNFANYYSGSWSYVSAYDNLFYVYVKAATGNFFVFLCETWERHDKLWKPKGLIIPEGI